MWMGLGVELEGDWIGSFLRSGSGSALDNHFLPLNNFGIFFETLVIVVQFQKY